MRLRAGPGMARGNPLAITPIPDDDCNVDIGGTDKNCWFELLSASTPLQYPSV